MLSNVILAESITHRSRFAWLAAGLAATVALFALSFGDAAPASASQRRPRVEMRKPMCGEARAFRADRDRDQLQRKIERARERAQRAAERAERRAAREAERAREQAQREVEQAQREVEQIQRDAERAVRDVERAQRDVERAQRDAERAMRSTPVYIYR
jgi:ADP-ribosylglycohydrolase